MVRKRIASKVRKTKEKLKQGSRKIKTKVKETKDKIKKEVKEEFVLNVPNTITLIRLLLTFLIIFLIIADYPLLLVGIVFAIAASSDWFDGFFARKLKQTSNIGARLDQVIDRIFMIPIVFVLLFKFYVVNQGIFFLLLICLSREIISFPGLVIRLIRNIDAYKVKYIGKVTTFFQSIAIGLIIISELNSAVAFIALAFSFITGLAGIVAGLDYVRDSIRAY